MIAEIKDLIRNNRTEELTCQPINIMRFLRLNLDFLDHPGEPRKRG